MQLVSVEINTFLILIQVLSLLLHFVIVEGTPILRGLEQNVTSNSTYSPWLRQVKNPRAIGCWTRPWICNQGEFPLRIKRLCCRNRCVDVTSDVNNCGLCGIRCPFNWQCCRGLCININVNPFHCGSCEHRCRFPSFCIFGMCGYAQPLPPFPFPFPPRPPFPPIPFPPKPFPPKPFPPKPFPPKPFPPKPFPPKPFPPKPFPPKPFPPKPFPPKPFPPKPFPPRPWPKPPRGSQPPPVA
ncbi:Stigma-specific STIG1-like protein 4 [Abeliophyllum distichum]|uniref:Stigma-specific STIG1-like protein 4 n=1 Tax=Abeliophyllum distichum TaxID=126358 RepID=A0ABD1RV37_9LAMI